MALNDPTIWNCAKAAPTVTDRGCCRLPNGDRTMLKHEECDDAGGVWLGGDCQGCCKVGLDYLILGQEDCFKRNGKWLGGECTVPTGCCKVSPTEYVTLTEKECAECGEWLGDNTECPTLGCCVFANKREQMTQHDCECTGGTFVEGCCDAVKGCCKIECSDGEYTYEEMTAAECNKACGKYLGDCEKCPAIGCCGAIDPITGQFIKFQLSREECFRAGAGGIVWEAKPPGQAGDCGCADYVFETSGTCVGAVLSTTGEFCECETNVSIEDCVNNGGGWTTGVWTQPTDDPCPVAVCCKLPTAEYVDNLLACECEDAGGRVIAIDPCEAPTGCCRNADGSFTPDQTEFACLQSGGAYQGDGRECPPMGCCTADDCSQTITEQVNCTGDWEELPAGVTECPAPVTVCCKYPSAEYKLVTECECQRDGGTVQANNPTCTAPTGCCENADGTFTEGGTEFACIQKNPAGVWSGDGLECPPLGCCEIDCVKTGGIYEKDCAGTWTEGNCTTKAIEICCITADGEYIKTTQCLCELNGGTVQILPIGQECKKPCPTAPEGVKIGCSDYVHATGVYTFDVAGSPPEGCELIVGIFDGAEMVAEGDGLTFNKLAWAQANGAYLNCHSQVPSAPAQPGFPVIAEGTPKTLTAKLVLRCPDCPDLPLDEATAGSVELCPRQYAFTFDQTANNEPGAGPFPTGPPNLAGHTWSQTATGLTVGQPCAAAGDLTFDEGSGSHWCAGMWHIQQIGSGEYQYQLSQASQSNGCDTGHLVAGIETNCGNRTLNPADYSDQDTALKILAAEFGLTYAEGYDDAGTILVDQIGTWYWFGQPAEQINGCECSADHCVYEGKIKFTHENGSWMEVCIKPLHTF